MKMRELVGMVATPNLKNGLSNVRFKHLLQGHAQKFEKERAAIFDVQVKTKKKVFMSFDVQFTARYQVKKKVFTSSAYISGEGGGGLSAPSPPGYVPALHHD